MFYSQPFKKLVEIFPILGKQPETATVPGLCSEGALLVSLLVVSEGPRVKRVPKTNNNQ